MPFFVKIHDKVGTDYEKDNQYEVINIDIMENKEEIKEPEQIKGMGRIVELELCPPRLIGNNIFKNIGILSVVECLNGTDIRPIVPTRLTCCKKTKLEQRECEKGQTQEAICDLPWLISSVSFFWNLSPFPEDLTETMYAPWFMDLFYRWYYLRGSDLGPGSFAAG
jgi:hypothetical protein